jgi:hypothetical protein
MRPRTPTSRIGSVATTRKCGVSDGLSDLGNFILIQDLERGVHNNGQEKFPFDIAILVDRDN